MIKGYWGCLQFSPKDGMIPNRVRHLFIFLARLYPLPPEPFVVFLPSRVFGKDIHPSFLQQRSDSSSSRSIIPSDNFPSKVASTTEFIYATILSLAGMADVHSPAEIFVSWRLTSYVVEPLEFKARHGKLLAILSTKVDEGLMSVLVQFYDPLYRCFTFLDFQIFPILEEYAYHVGIPILDRLSCSGLEKIPSSQEIADMLHVEVSDVVANMTTKGGIQGLPFDFLIAKATLFGKAMSKEAFEAIFVLLIYGLVFFPNIDNFMNVNAIRIFSSLNPVPTLLGDTYFSLHMRNAKGGGSITLAFKENKGCLRWSTRLMSLTNYDISWYNRVYDGIKIIHSCGEFSNVPLIGTRGGINYNPALARRQLGFPLKDKPNNISLEGLFFQEGKYPQNLKDRMVRAWCKVHRKGRNELGPRNCVALEPYTSWVRKRALEYHMPYEYLRPTPMVMVRPSTLPNQGVEELRDEDWLRAWVREREELLQQLKDKDAIIEFLEHQVIDEPDDVVTSLLPHSFRFWKKIYDQLPKEKADMEAAYEREVKRLRATYLPISKASDDCF
ncbi:hypothetical protein KIW84_031558 [Lathyrus oleraceus]|uniref:DUF7745 domain-containing protein n=1 Tax=Pisum sativum TaxID=3888 RepID=A0A9D5AXL5_PEA|nr:hypothetical protein KIW84_031558 [Pisum sativum]